MLITIAIVTGIVSASIDAWQPTVNTVALILLALVGNGQIKRHKRRTDRRGRIQERRLREVEGVAAETERLIGRIEELLDNTSGPESRHLH